MSTYSYLIKYTFLKSNDKMVVEVLPTSKGVTKYRNLCKVCGEKPLNISKSIKETGKFKHEGANLIFEVRRFLKGYGYTPK